ncbi:hypothetical protein [Rheinheimera nanhaiensis]|uniref:hypothetical protein n=1 Tax=Rheinheimera nanhaiensis TaxID=1163621 RepID=UPI00192C8CFD|nr:hypothetical protein [Rheinheimera nanhaiensis]
MAADISMGRIAIMLAACRVGRPTLLWALKVMKAASEFAVGKAFNNGLLTDLLLNVVWAAA